MPLYTVHVNNSLSSIFFPFKEITILQNQDFNQISEMLIQANVAKIFLRLALAINGAAEKYTADAIGVNSCTHNLPTFCATDIAANKNISMCSSIICPDYLDNNVAYSDDVYGHLWFAKPVACSEVGHMQI